jgi:hypothetical protein
VLQARDGGKSFEFVGHVALVPDSSMTAQCRAEQPPGLDRTPGVPGDLAEAAEHHAHAVGFARRAEQLQPLRGRQQLRRFVEQPVSLVQVSREPAARS